MHQNYVAIITWTDLYIGILPQEYHKSWIFCEYVNAILEFGNHHIYQELSTFE